LLLFEHYLIEFFHGRSFVKRGGHPKATAVTLKAIRSAISVVTTGGAGHHLSVDRVGVRGARGVHRRGHTKRCQPCQYFLNHLKLLLQKV
jgi:hypothetical protein